MAKPDGIRLGYFGPGTDKFNGLKLRDEKGIGADHAFPERYLPQAGCQRARPCDPEQDPGIDDRRQPRGQGQFQPRPRSVDEGCLARGTAGGLLPETHQA